MKMIRNSFLLLFICTLSAYSQQNDFQSWSSIKISKKIYKRTNFSVKEGIRFRENSSLISKNFTDVKISHRIKKTDFEVSVGYRFSNDFNLDFTSESKHRYYVDWSLRFKDKRFKISLRDRVQYQGNSSGFSTLFRQKLDVSYNVRKTPFEPFLQFEFFINMNEEFEKLRYTIGFSQPIFKDLNADLFYRIQQTLNTDNPENMFIIGTKLSYKL